ncbi:MAG: S41 family peptidase [Acidobacteriota bacterium]|nr:S41 family peptidase [Acidobacteriota bacterium]
MTTIMKTLVPSLLLLLVPAAAFADLTPDQKRSDFVDLAGLYDKQYAPYEWKRLLFGFDALNIAPWLDRVAKTTNDLDFYELCIEYVASLNDTHDGFSLPSDFSANLGMNLDIYDGKVLIETINRTLLPQSKYPFQVGDELVSVDGKDVNDLLNDFVKYAHQGNPRSARRIAASRIVSRPQSIMPHAAELGDNATLVIRGQDASTQTYTIPWNKTGTPLGVGIVPTPKSQSQEVAGIASDEPVPDYLQLWRDVQYSGVSGDTGVLNYGSRTPIFALPSNFVQRQGLRTTDFFYSGTYPAGGARIGYIRIPTYGSLAASVQQEFDTEIAYFQANTDGLIVDEMRNTGGFLCFGENIMTRLVPYPFQSIGYELRATQSRLNSFYSNLQAAKNAQADQWIIDSYQAWFNDVLSAFKENRGLTGPLPLCADTGQTRYPATDRNGDSIAYTRPVMMLIDEFSTSTADSVPAMFQDARRGPLFGWRTNGAGGTNTTFDSGAYSEGATGMTLGLMNRPTAIAVDGFPTTTHIENVGVRPDIEVDYMTKDNLLQRGKPFVDAFTAAMVNLIQNK